MVAGVGRLRRAGHEPGTEEKPVSLLEVPAVSEWSVDGCSYDHDAGCGTFVGLGAEADWTR